MMSINVSKCIVVAWCVLLLAAIFQLVFNTNYQTDMAEFLPQSASSPLGQRVQEGAVSRVWLVALRGAPSAELSRASKVFAQQLRGSDDFRRVLNGDGEIEETAQALIYRYRYLLDDRIGQDYFSGSSLHQFLEQRLDELRSPLSAFSKQWLRGDPTGATLHLLEKLENNGPARMQHDGVWMNAARDQALMLAETRVSGLDLDSQQAIRSRMADAFDAAIENKKIELLLSGVPEIALQTRNTVRSDAQRLSMIASLLMVLFLVWVYRSATWVLLSALPLAGGVIMAAAAVSVWFGSIHMVTLAFGITVLGVAVDYPIHLLSHMRQGESAAATMTRIWPTLRLGVISTVVAYLAMALTSFDGLAQLGLFSIVGLSVAALITRSLLPILSPDLPVSSNALGRLRCRLVSPAPSTLTWLAAIGVLGGAGYLVQQENVWSDDLARLSPIPAELRNQDRRLREQMAGPAAGYLIAVEAKSPEGVLQRQEQLLPVLDAAVVAGEIGGYSLAAGVLPSQKMQRQRQKLLPDESFLRQNLDEALLGLPFHARGFDVFIQDVGAARHLAPLTPAGLENGLQQQLAGLLVDSEQGAVGIVRLRGVERSPALQKRLRDGSFPGVRFVDMKQSSNEAVARFRAAATERILWASALILVTLWLGLRDYRRLLRILLPVVGAVITAAAVAFMAGTGLNLFNLVSLMLVAGIGLDYSLFFSRPKEEGDASATLHALLVCSISTVTVFAILSTSAIPVLNTIGVTVFAGVIAAFVFAWLFSRVSW